MRNAPRWAAGTRRRGTPACRRRAACASSVTKRASFVRRLPPSIKRPHARRTPLRPGALLSREGHERRQRGVFGSRTGDQAAGAGHPVLEDFVYTSGLREEFAIAANYARDPVRKDRGFAACNWLALNREIGDAPRELAWSNLYFYMQPANEIMPSFEARRIDFAAPAVTSRPTLRSRAWATGSCYCSGPSTTG